MNRIVSIVEFGFMILLPLLYSCSAYNVVNIGIRSEPSGAKVYFANDAYLGLTPLILSYEVPRSVYENNAKAWDLGIIKLYLAGFQPQTKDLLLDISNHEIPGSRSRPWAYSKEEYNYNFLIVFNSKSSTDEILGDDFYISAFTETKGGSYPLKRDSFNKSEVPEVIIIGFKSKLTNIKVYSISSKKLVFEDDSYVPEQNNTYLHVPIQNLTPDSYKVDCSIEGIVVKTLFFTISN